MSLPRCFLALRWRGPSAAHRDRIWLASDACPPGHPLSAAIARLAPGDRDVVDPPEGLVPPAGVDVPLSVRASAWKRSFAGREILPRQGRFYPRALLEGQAARDLRPMRVLDVLPDALLLDLAHPLARHACTVEIEAAAADAARAGGVRLEDLAAGGPGMQERLPDAPTDFLSGTPCARRDESPDADFYAVPRLVHHLDANMRGELTRLYARLLSGRRRVLDLMASWVSHLPPQAELEVTGIGLNAEELARNERLHHAVVQDLNARPRLPFDDASFDAVICTASVEYLVQPLAVFREAARVLAPGGVFAIAFSDRWFPPKAIALWAELHPFERMGLVLHWFEAAGGFCDLNTESLRGLPRPAEDRHYAQRRLADPLFAVWGRRVDAPPGRA